MKVGFKFGLAPGELLALAAEGGQPDSDLVVFAVETSALERGQVAVHGGAVVAEFPFNHGKLILNARADGGMIAAELREGLVDEVGPVGVEVDQGAANGVLDLVGVEAVHAAAGFGPVANSAPAGVVAVSLVAAVGGGADEAASAVGAADAPGQGVVGRVGGAFSDHGGAGGQDGLGFGELDGRDQHRVGVDHDDVPEDLFTDVDPVLNHDFDRVG